MGKHWATYEKLFESKIKGDKELMSKVNEEFVKYEEALGSDEKITQMAKENRAYEAKLKVAAATRTTYQKGKTEGELLAWKTAITESTLYANEAHCTAGAIIQTVANKQMIGGKSFKGESAEYEKLKLTKDELFHSFTEQIGFIFHRIPKLHNDEDFIKLGKYIHRAFNSLKLYCMVAKPKLDSKDFYTESMRKAATDWGGLKKGRARGADSKKFTINVQDLTLVEKNAIRDNMLKNFASKSENPIYSLIELKLKVDASYFG